MSDRVFRIKYGIYAQRLRDMGITQGDLADKAGTSPQHLSDIVTGRKPRVSAAIAFAIAEAMSMQPSELFELVPATKATRPKEFAAAAL